MISTGINGVDDMLGGGIPKGSRVLYSMEPGVNGQLFMVSSLCRAIANNLSCLVILPHTTVEAFHNDVLVMKEGTINSCPENIIFVDAIDRERIQKSSPSPIMAQREWKARIAKIYRERKIDVVFAYFDLLAEDFGIKGGLEILGQGNKDSKQTLILEMLNMEGEPLLTRFIHDFSFDVVISIKSSFLQVPHFDYFSIVHTSWSHQPSRSMPFVSENGRIIPYIPRIVVTGPAQSGKSMFVTTASSEKGAINFEGVNGDSGTVARDIGMVQWKGFDITICGASDLSLFDQRIPGTLINTIGVILMIDVTKPALLPRAKKIIGLLSERNMPMVIAANKNDLPGRMGENEIRNALGIEYNIPLFFISATRKNDVLQVLESLVDSITQFTY